MFGFARLLLRYKFSVLILAGLAVFALNRDGEPEPSNNPWANPAPARYVAAGEPGMIDQMASSAGDLLEEAGVEVDEIGLAGSEQASAGIEGASSSLSRSSSN